ncbi:MAG: TENA/THI-4 protein [Acidobacteria bacterium]|nr:MAG: TENA/THI-4 protein [Acidobacteriota bacterium]
MTTQEFFTGLDARIAKYDLLGHPFYKAWSVGELTREDLREYAQQYFQHVNAFPEYLQEFASRPHSELWLDFVEGMGGERTGRPKRLPELDSLTDQFHAAAKHGTPEEALATFYAYESQVPRVAAEKARGLQQMYGADAKTCDYFTLHTTADVYHSRVWKQQLANAVNGNPGAAQRALDAGESAAKALWTALDGIESERTARAA